MPTRLVACETTSAVVTHLRKDDGTFQPNGSLSPKLMLCGGGLARFGWDCPSPPPATPEDAKTTTQAQRYCGACVRVWEELEKS